MTGDRGEAPLGAAHLAGVGQVVDDHDSHEQPRDRRGQRLRDVDDVLQPARPGRRRTWHDRTGPGVRHDSETRPASSDLSTSNATSAASAESTATASAYAPSAADTAVSYPGSTRTSAATEPRTPDTRSEAASRGRGAVLARRRESSASTCCEPGPFPLGLLLVQPQRGDPLVGGGERGRRRLVLRVQPHLTLVQAGDLRLDAGSCCCACAARARASATWAVSVSLAPRASVCPAGATDLPRQPRETFAPVGGGAYQAGEAGLLGPHVLGGHPRRGCAASAALSALTG